MKRILPIFLIILMLASCKFNTPVTDDGKDKTEYEPTDTAGMNTVYIVTQSGCVPVSVVENGTNTLSDDVYYYDLRSVIENETKLKEKKYTYFDIDGKNRGSTNYKGMTENKIKSEPYKMLIMSGNWKLCPDMRHTVYDGKKTADSSYSEYIVKSFADKFSGISPNITDLWECDLDADGTNEAVVLAKGDGYTVLAMLSQTYGNKILCSDFKSGNTFVAYPFFVDLNGDGVYSLAVISGNGLKTFTVYDEKINKTLYTVYLPLQS